MGQKRRVARIKVELLSFKNIESRDGKTLCLDWRDLEEEDKQKSDTICCLCEREGESFGESWRRLEL